MSHYWRHPALAHLEIRNVEDGRTFSHARHSHSTFSIGAIMQGQSTYLNGDSSRLISAGSVVLMNPGVVHACNPVHAQPWAYRMFYVDAQWLADLQQQQSFGTQKGFVPFAQTYSADVGLFDELDDLARSRPATARQIPCRVQRWGFSSDWWSACSRSAMTPKVNRTKWPRQRNSSVSIALMRCGWRISRRPCSFHLPI